MSPTNKPPAYPGLDTPALLLDLDSLDKNIRRMAAFFRRGRSRLRPHFKTHKCTPIAWRQLRAGAVGITCATVDEAESLAAAGIRDILIANQVVGDGKIARLVALAHETDVMIAVDNARNARDVARAARQQAVSVRCLVEVDTGMGRCGVTPARAAALARSTARMEGLALAGLMGYEGHCVFIEDKKQREDETRHALGKLISAVRAVRAETKLRSPVVSAGGTGTCRITGRFPGVTEVQAGSYATMDAKYARLVPGFACALTVLATVISRPSSGVAVLDSGMKAISPEFGMPTAARAPGVEIVKLAEEHAVATLSEEAKSLAVGDRVELVPAHGCTTVNLHGWYNCVLRGEVVATWSIAAGAFTR